MGQSAQAYAEVSTRRLGGVAPPPSPACRNTVKSIQSTVFTAQPVEGSALNISLRTNPVFKRGEHTSNRHLHTDTRECSDWLQHQFRQQSAKVISEKTGQGQRAAEAVKMGRNGLTMAHLVNICRADPDFRAQFFAFCGGQLEGDPEMVAALSKAINAVMQGRGHG